MKKSSKTLLITGVSIAVVAAGGWVISARKQHKSASSAPEALQGVSVVMSEVREMPFEETIEISGNVEAKNTALVSARIPGIVDEIFVDEGDAVEKGQKLFQTDKLNLGKALEAAHQQVAVAAAAVSARLATLERFEADMAKVKVDFERYKRLYEEDRAVTKNVYEAQELRFRETQAALKEAEAGLILVRAQEAQARSSLAIAGKNLSDSLVASPISGRVSSRMLEPGEIAGAGTPVVRIEDLSTVEFVAYLPEAYYGRVKKGTTVMRARVQDADIGQAVVTTKSPTIHPRLRTFEVRALMKNPPSGVVPGARADLSVILRKRTGLGVPRAAVLQRGQGLVVFTVRDGKARMLSVEPGLETDGWLEVRGDGLTKDVRVVRMGQERLNDGTAVVEVEEEK